MRIPKSSAHDADFSSRGLRRCVTCAFGKYTGATVIVLNPLCKFAEPPGANFSKRITQQYRHPSANGGDPAKHNLCMRSIASHTTTMEICRNSCREQRQIFHRPPLAEILQSKRSTRHTQFHHSLPRAKIFANPCKPSYKTYQEQKEPSSR